MLEYLNDSITRQLNEGDFPVFPICFALDSGWPSARGANVTLVADPQSTATEGMVTASISL